jgi:hypothetical protein
MICVNRPSSPPAGPGSDSVLLIACPDRGARSSAARRDSPIYGALAKLNPGAHEVACFVADAASHVTIGSVCQNAAASPNLRHLDRRAPTDGLPTRSYPWSGHSGSRQDLSSAPASASPSDERSGVRRADGTSSGLYQRRSAPSKPPPTPTAKASGDLRSPGRSGPDAGVEPVAAVVGALDRLESGSAGTSRQQVVAVGRMAVARAARPRAAAPRSSCGCAWSS